MTAGVMVRGGISASFPSSASPGLMNADYVVDSTGNGTHTTLYGALGALKAAVDSGLDKTIWVCTSHAETVAAETALGSPVAGQRIIISSDGGRVKVNVGSGACVFNTAAAIGGPPVFEFKGVRHTNIAPTASNFYRPTSVGAYASVLILDDCHFDFDGTVGGVTWGWLYVGHTFEGNAASLGGMKIINGRYKITSFWTTDNSSNDAAWYGLGAAGDLLGQFSCVGANIVATNINTRFGAASIDGFQHITMVANTMQINGGGLNVGTDYGGLLGSLLFACNTINHTANTDFISIGNNCSYITVTGNNYGTSGAAGALTTFFHNQDSTPVSCIVMGNSLRGPGGGSVAINIQGLVPASGGFEPNGFSNWGANVSGTGAGTIFTGVLTVAGLVINNTVTTDISGSFQRSGVLKSYYGIWRTDILQAPFGANDFHFGTYDGAFHDVMAFANNGTQMKLNVPLISTSYGFLGSAGGTGATWPGPANTTIGDMNVGRLIAGANVAVPAGGSVIFGNQGTLGNEVYRLMSVSVNDDPTEITVQDRVATVDATVTTLHAFTIPATTTYQIQAVVTARRTGGAGGTAEDGAGYIVVATVKNVAGVATLIGAVNQLVVQEDQVAWDATIDVTAATARVRVTGALNNNVTWHLTARCWMLST